MDTQPPSQTLCDASYSYSFIWNSNLVKLEGAPSVTYNYYVFNVNKWRGEDVADS